MQDRADDKKRDRVCWSVNGDDFAVWVWKGGEVVETHTSPKAGPPRRNAERLARRIAADLAKQYGLECVEEPL